LADGRCWSVEGIEKARAILTEATPGVFGSEIQIRPIGVERQPAQRLRRPPDGHDADEAPGAAGTHL
jgi:hypothetical protein